MKVVEQEEQTFTPIVITIESVMEKEIMDVFFNCGSEIMKRHHKNSTPEVIQTQFLMYQRWKYRKEDC